MSIRSKLIILEEDVAPIIASAFGLVAVAGFVALNTAARISEVEQGRAEAGASANFIRQGVLPTELNSVIKESSSRGGGSSITITSETVFRNEAGEILGGSFTFEGSLEKDRVDTGASLTEKQRRLQETLGVQ